jgi:hypothetical protein
LRSALPWAGWPAITDLEWMNKYFPQSLNKYCESASANPLMWAKTPCASQLKQS